MSIEATTTENTYVVTNGGTVVVTCIATGGIAPTNINFLTPRGLLVTDSDHLYLSATTLTQLGISETPLYQAWRTLTISGAAFEDSGTYTCSAANGTVEDTSEFHVSVEGA